jgi:hypothetical protein
MTELLRLWCQAQPNDIWGLIRPEHLSFDTPEEGERVAKRYRAMYPTCTFVVSIKSPRERVNS